MTDRIILADKKYRKKIFIIYFISVVSGGVLIWWGLPWTKGHIRNLDPDSALNNLIMLVRFMFLSIVPFGVYILSLGCKVLKHQQFPPPDTKVIKDTRIIVGEKALMRGRFVIAVALSLIAVCLIGGLYLPYKLSNTFGIPATSIDELVCGKFQEKLLNLKHQKNVMESASFEFKNNVYKGCELIFETKWSEIGMEKDPTDMFYPHEGNELYQMGWRSDDKYLADGPGSSFNVIRNGDILCTVKWYFVSFIDGKTNEFVTGDDLSCQIRCGKESKN
jgi:hypothetical protein